MRTSSALYLLSILRYFDEIDIILKNTSMGWHSKYCGVEYHKLSAVLGRVWGHVMYFNMEGYVGRLYILIWNGMWRGYINSINMLLYTGVDFTVSNLHQGERTFGGKSLHAIQAGVHNPYQQVSYCMK